MTLTRRHGRNAFLAVLALCVVALFVIFVHPVWLGEQSVRLMLWRHGVKSRSVIIDGNRIHYLEAEPKGAAKAVPVLLVHGLGGRADDWAVVLPELAAEGYHVYAPDLLGYGHSAQPKDATTRSAKKRSSCRGSWQAVASPRRTSSAGRWVGGSR